MDRITGSPPSIALSPGIMRFSRVDTNRLLFRLLWRRLLNNKPIIGTSRQRAGLYAEFITPIPSQSADCRTVMRSDFRGTWVIAVGQMWAARSEGGVRDVGYSGREVLESRRGLCLVATEVSGSL